MKAFVSKSEVRGRVTAPSSKSYTIRALIGAALARGWSEIAQPLTSDDTEAALDVLRRLGVVVEPGRDSWRVSGGNLRAPAGELFCGDSAATMRFMTAICATIPGRCRLVPGRSLAKRPMATLLEALGKLGVTCSQDKTGAVTVVGGRLKGGATELRGDISSQYVSALLFISPLGEGNIRISLTTPLESRPYVAMTLECLERFGIRVTSSPDLREFETEQQAYVPARCQIEGDWSSASYFLALGALAGEVEVGNLNENSLQGDRELANHLRRMGARLESRASSVVVKQATLKAIRADLTDCIDLLPTVAVLAAVASGTSELTGIARARIKESNRVAAVCAGLEGMGIKVTEESGRISITGGRPHGAIIDSRDDHRIAMAFSVLGTVTGDTVINGAECVSKTYPEFWGTLKSIGGKVQIDGQ